MWLVHPMVHPSSPSHLYVTDTNNTAGYPADWPAKRQQQLELDGHRCRACGITDKQLADLNWAPLQVHHVNQGPPHYAGPYHREVPGENLMTLCPDCHDGITDSVRRQRYRLDPGKKVELRETSLRSISAPEDRTNAPVEITVTEQQAQAERTSSARRVEIRLFND